MSELTSRIRAKRSRVRQRQTFSHTHTHTQQQYSQLKSVLSHRADYVEAVERIDGTRSNLDRDEEYVRMTRDIEKLRKDISHLESPDELNNLVPDGAEAESDFQAALKPLELFLRNSVKGGDFSPGPANVQFVRALRDAKASMIEFRDHFGFAALSPSDVLERLNARADQRSGTISEDGFCSALYEMHQSTFKKANKERQIMKESDANALSVLLFRAFDFDNNNVLDVFELSAGLSLLCAGSPASLLANVFRTWYSSVSLPSSHTFVVREVLEHTSSLVLLHL